jgi:pimeloyl-ACP methyl ester carboxylesterase
MSVTPLPEPEAPPRHDIPRCGRSGFAVVDGRQVHYLEWGHRGLPPVLGLHGGGQTAYMFEELGASAGRRHHLLAPDLPNHGDSDPLRDTFGPGGIATTLRPLLDEFGMGRVVLVGASLGGLTGIRFGAEHPDRLAGLVLIDVGHRLEPEGVRKIVDFMRAHESFASLEEAAAEISEYLPQRREVRPESLSRNLRQRPDGRWEWKHGFGKRFREAVRDDRHPADHLEQFLEGVEESSRRLRCPVLVLRGATSDVLSAEGAEEVTAAIPDARLATVERAGHLAAGDNPNSTTNLIIGFLDELRW